MNSKSRLMLSGILLIITLVVVSLQHSFRSRAGLVTRSSGSHDPDGPAASNTTALPSLTVRARLVETYGKMPLSFEANQGQTDPQVKFLSRGSGYTLFLTGNKAVLGLRTPERKASIETQQPRRRVRQSSLQHRKSEVGNSAAKARSRNENAVLSLRLVKGNPQARVVGLDELPGRSNYFIGNDPSKWRSGVRNYAKVKYEGVYPGVDLVYYGNQGQLEYDFVVAPGADPRVVTLALEQTPSDGRPLQIDRDGNLRVGVRGNEVVFHKPFVYQTASADLQSQVRGRDSIDGRYRVKGDREVTFEVTSYDHSKPLVIDPVLSYSSFLGGPNQDSSDSVSVAVDPAGNAYVASGTLSAAFPVTPGSFQTGFGGSPAICDQATICGDAFVTKINPAGTAIVYSTYLGGSSSDYAFGLAVDAMGNTYVTGDTESANFPVTPGAFQPTFGGQPAVCERGYCGDTFVAKLNPTGSILLYSSYLGGSGNDSSQAIVFDSSGNAYVTGTTDSADFPTTPGAFQTKFTGNDNCVGRSGANIPCEDAYVTKINPTGTALVYSTYLGGFTGDDGGNGIATDGSGHAMVTGVTCSTDFPVTKEAFQSQNGGVCDVFLTAFDTIGSKLLYSTYFGGNGYDVAYAVDVGSGGNAYLVGQTFSSNFPVTAGALQTNYGGNGDAFVAKFNRRLDGAASLVYSTYLGGSANDGGVGVAVDSFGDAFVTGGANSPNFPTVRPLQAVNAGGGDAFVAEVNPWGSALLYSTFVGGSNGEYGDSLALDPNGNAYVAGPTQSADFPTTPRAFQPAFAGGAKDVFVVKIGLADTPGVSFVPATLNFGNQAVNTTSPPQTVVLHNVGSAALTISSIHTVGDFTAQANTCGGSLAGGGNCAISITFTPSTAGMRTGMLSVSDNAAHSPQKITLTGTGAP